MLPAPIVRMSATWASVRAPVILEAARSEMSSSETEPSVISEPSTDKPKGLLSTVVHTNFPLPSLVRVCPFVPVVAGHSNE